VSNGSRYGIYTAKGEQIVPVNYQQIRAIDKDFLVLTNPNEVHYLYLPEKRIIQPILRGE
jgi:sporulation protein YlmC with PRC-barrel domain